MAASSSSPSPSPSPRPIAQQPSRRIPPPCWSHQETVALIDAYRAKWYSLNRGNLRASHWQEVADSVGRTCRLVSPPKTSLQCRHKIEKLRKRYRTEKQRSLAAGPHAGPPSWPYFRKMDSMEIGGASPDTSDDDDEFDARVGNTRSLHRLLLNGAGHRSGASAAAASAGVRTKVEERRNSGGDDLKRGSPSSSGFDAVASAVRMVGDGFMRIEKMKMEIAKETERVRMDMELKRTEMIIESQQRIFDVFLEGFGGKERAKRMPLSPEN
ncbi:trihelix transcription factor ENAP1-like [Magnolia sinica]|uniref:trihelix transcription factor ENAP1-like n=1 Tax=Magnolia sinica TaxID=86752 RepID=UPI00265B6036|nr:trihelix transcription factor ENAP1-like [Magnolia sinica]XP_058085372.1 trihelix transcription factor ENAP1-like [Magnolia sinica]XP_058085373.1 trihelix transcription factor ENAP1-like [Magnolia sinica]